MDPILLILLLLILFVPSFLMMRREKKRQQEVQALQGSLTPGDRVVTVAGIHGTVVEVDSDTIVLEIAPGVDTTWDTRAIVRVVDRHADVHPEDALPENLPEADDSDSGRGEEASDHPDKPHNI